MATFRLKNLLLSSLLVWLTSCAIPLKYKFVAEKKITLNDITSKKQADSVSTYKMQIFLFNKYFTGILLDKKTDSTTRRLVFVTEIGMKMFDIETNSDSTKMVYCFNPLNQPKTVWLLENDLGFLWLQHFINKQAKIYESKCGKRAYCVKEGKKKYIYYTRQNLPEIETALVCGPLFTKQKAVYKYGLGNELESVSLKHKGLLRLRIKLNKIKHE